MSSEIQKKDFVPIEFWVTFTQAELTSLIGMHHDFSWPVYAVLRMHMDGTTKTVTSTWDKLCEMLRTKPVPGSTVHKGGIPTKDAVVHAVRVLIERGLVERISKNRTLILLLPKAPSKRNEKDRREKLSHRASSPGGTLEEHSMRSTRPEPLISPASAHSGALEENGGISASSTCYSNNQSLPPESNLVNHNSLPLDTLRERARGKTFEDLKLCDPLWKEFLGMYPKLDDVDSAEKLWRTEKLWKFWPDILADLSVRKWPAMHWIPSAFNYLFKKKWKDQTKGERLDADTRSAVSSKKSAIESLFSDLKEENSSG